MSKYSQIIKAHSHTQHHKGKRLYLVLPGKGAQSEGTVEAGIAQQSDFACFYLLSTIQRTRKATSNQTPLCILLLEDAVFLHGHCWRKFGDLGKLNLLTQFLHVYTHTPHSLNERITGFLSSF